MLRVLKKGLMFLFVLVIASILFSVNAQENTSSSAADIVEIIEGEDQKLTDGYVEDQVPQQESDNIFVSIVKVISSFIKAIFQTILNLISKIVSSFSSFRYFIN